MKKIYLFIVLNFVCASILCFISLHGVLDAHPMVIYRPNNENRFQPVGDNHTSYVYSAYHDHRNGHVIRIMAIVKDNLPKNYFICLSNNTRSNQRVPHEAELNYIVEPKWGYKYRSAIITCRVNEKHHFPKIISIVENGKQLPIINHLIVRYNNKKQRNFTRCVPALHDFNDKTGLIQMIESDLFFGMQKFIIYHLGNLTVGDVLDHYRRNGVIELHNWSLPIDPSDIHYYGQLLNIHECLYLNMNVSDYILFSDIDEIVIPKSYESWQELTINLFKKDCGALIFRNAFFPTLFPSYPGKYDGKSLAKQYNLTFFSKAIRCRLHSYGDRSKFLVATQLTLLVDIHNVRSFTSKHLKRCRVNSQDALLHHYRKQPSPDMKLPYVNDTIMHKFSPTLIPRIVTVLDLIKL